MYDDSMMGLEVFDADMIKDHVLAAAAGGATAFGVGYLASKIPLPESWEPQNRLRAKLGIAAAAGIAVGGMVGQRNPEAGTAITGAVTGLSLLGLVMTFVKPEDTAMALTLPGLSDMPEADELDDADDEALLSMYDDGSMSDLHTPGVNTAPPAFADPTVTPEALFGLDGTMVQEETLGYQPYLS